MIWFGIFLLGLGIVGWGRVKALRTRKPDMLMLNGAIIAFVGSIGQAHWPAGIVPASWMQAGTTAMVFRIGGWGVAAWTLYQLVWSLRALTWPAAEAIIEHSEAVFVGTRSGDLNGRRNTTRYAWRLSYSYRIAGRTYTASTRSLDTDEDDLDMRSANELAAKYPKGSKVTIFHHPRHPGLACLERPWINGRWIVPGVFAAMMLWAGYAA